MFLWEVLIKFVYETFHYLLGLKDPGNHKSMCSPVAHNLEETKEK